MSRTVDPSAPPRERILSAALATFAARGFEASSIAEVADAAGMSKQALMYHFPTKVLLREGVYGRLAEDLRAQLPGAAAELVTRSVERYRALVEGVFGRFMADAQVSRFLVFELLERPDELMAWLREEAEPWLGLIRGLTVEWSQLVGEHDNEAHAAAMVVMMLAQSALVPRADEAWHARVGAAALRLMLVGSHLQTGQIDEAS